jgi:DNA-binding ferritin-like protein (Dps family)
MLSELRLKKLRLKEQKKLNESNLMLYKSITLYIQNSDLREIDKEEILQQIMDMMLQAQAEDKSVDSVIGRDYEKFCRDIIEEYNRGEGVFYRVLNYIQKYLLWLILITVFMAVLRKITDNSLDIGISIDQFILANIISLIIIPFSRKKMQESSYKTNWYNRIYIVNSGMSKWDSYAAGAMIGIMIISRIIIGRLFGIKVLSNIITIYAGIPYLIGAFLIIGAIEIYKRVYDR